MRFVFLVITAVLIQHCNSQTWTDEQTGYTWTYVIQDGSAIIRDGEYRYSASAAVSPNPTGIVYVPAVLGGCPVVEIGHQAFRYCGSMTQIFLPPSCIRLSYEAFSGCTGLRSIVLPWGLLDIGEGVFVGCTKIETISIPPTVTNIGSRAFAECIKLRSLGMPSGVRKIGERAFSCCWAFVNLRVPPSVREIERAAFQNCTGIVDAVLGPEVEKINEPFVGCRRLTRVDFEGRPPDGVDYLHFDAPGAVVRYNRKHEPEWERSLRYSMVVHQAYTLTSDIEELPVSIMTTNIVVKYVFNSVQPEFVVPVMSDEGFVNIIAEVKGGCVAVPATWTVNYPKFTEKFGSDFTKALAMQTGKKDGAGNPMFVWQDYVAGTDPTDETDVFTASITIVDGKVKVSYSPELDDARKAMRKYTTWGKASLLDAGWTEVEPGKEGDYNFFKVTVEMR